MKIEDYINERIKCYDKAHELENKYLDETTGEVVDFYLTNWKKAESFIKKLDETFLTEFNGTYFKFRLHELNSPLIYFIDHIETDKLLNLIIVCRSVGKNFRLGNYRNINSRKGFCESITEQEIIEKNNWHKVKEHNEKDLYILKNEIGRIKIGQSKNVIQRNHNIKIQAGVNIDIISKISGCSRYETVLHQIFKDRRIFGEWFELEQSEKDWLFSLNEINIQYEVNYIVDEIRLHKHIFIKKAINGI